MTNIEKDIREAVSKTALGYNIDEGTALFIQRFREIYGANLKAVIYYGSRLIEGLAKPSSFRDFFVVIDDYAPLMRDWFDRLTMRFMPPKMWFQSIEHNGVKQDAKYHVISLTDFQTYCSPRAPDHYVIGRMSKRVAIVYADGDSTRNAVADSLGDAFIENARRAAPFVDAPVSFEDAIKVFLSMSYRCELRLETPEKIDGLYRTSRHFFDWLYSMQFELFVADGILIKSGDNYLRAPSERRKIGKTKYYVFKSIARHIARFPFMIKNMDNWLDQLLGKYERTYGKQLVLTEAERKHRLLTAVKYFFKIKILKRRV